uniref:Uncharacterized protein n=1 Tax=Arundo donax TaxID=35708 RepID=A0A0A9FP65_ARUDO
MEASGMHYSNIYLLLVLVRLTEIKAMEKKWHDTSTKPTPISPPERTFARKRSNKVKPEADVSGEGGAVGSPELGNSLAATASRARSPPCPSPTWTLPLLVAICR